jgi:hypothetical protein
VRRGEHSKRWLNQSEKTRIEKFKYLVVAEVLKCVLGTGGKRMLKN